MQIYCILITEGLILKIGYNSLDIISKEIIDRNKCIVVYGAGMIGRVIMPFLLAEYGLEDRVLCFVDGDDSKLGLSINIGKRIVVTEGLDRLKKLPENTFFFITNSNYMAVISMLNSISKLDNTEGIIVPICLAERVKNQKKVREGIEKNSLEKIPRKIHYCWFSRSEMPSYLKKCIDSWKKHCPDYEIIRWDEDNYDYEAYPYMKQAYEAKKWGFVPDVARLDILYRHGGIYLDTDVELIKPLDKLLTLEAFCGVEKWGNVNMGGCSGAVKGHPMIKRLLDFRRNELFLREDGTLNLMTCGYYETMPLIEKGFVPNNTIQNIDGMTVLTSDYFHPYDYMSGDTIFSENTHSIHHFNGGWIDEKLKAERDKTKKEYIGFVENMPTLFSEGDNEF